MATLLIDVGQTLAGYRLVRELGRGGFGTVWEAIHDETGAAVALKTLLADLTRDDDQRTFARFVAEVQSVRRIQHPNVVRVLDAGRGQDRAGRALGFYAMELLGGGTLKQLVSAHKKLPARQAVRVVKEAALGVQAAHAAGVIHRDIKPENIMFDNAGRVVVVDFGVCRFAEDQDLTLTGQMVGTIRYMAPEQLLDGEADARADVFALGAVLFHALTGQHLRAQKDMRGMFKGVTRGDDLRRVEEGALPEAVTDLLRKALVPEVDQRIPTAEALSTALDALWQALPDEPELPLAVLPAPVEVTTSTSGRSLPPVMGALLEASPSEPLQPVSVCPQCGATFDTPEELEAHGPYCAIPHRPAREVPAEAFLPPAPPVEESLELAHEPVRHHGVRCEFCGEPFSDETTLAAHLDGCEMRRWHERNFSSRPMVMQQVLHAPTASQRPTEEPAPVVGGLMGKVKGWLRKPQAQEAPDEMAQLRHQVSLLQDPDAARLGNKGLELLHQMDDMLRQGVADPMLAEMLRPRVAESARRLVQLCTALHFGRQFLKQFPPVHVERELMGLRQRGAAPDAVMRKEALLKDARTVQTMLQENTDRLQGIIDALGRSAARLNLSLVGTTPEENTRLGTMLDGLILDMDAMSSAVREMRKLGLD
ncbi:MAG: protein kinase [Myxococcota bacterium]